MESQKIIEGMNIISKHQGDSENFIAVSTVAGDQIFCGGHDSVTNEEDVARLLELGWFEDEDSWSCFT